MNTRTTLVLVALIGSPLWVGCGFRTQKRTANLAASETNPAATRMTNFISLAGGSPEEQPPTGLSREILIDEARIESVSDAQICFAITQRTHVDRDMPLSQWRARVNRSEAYIEEGPITVADYPVTGERVTFSADAILPEALASLQLTEPTEEIYRVYQRTGSLCAPTPPLRQVTLTLTLPQGGSRSDWGQTYIWNLQ